MPVKRLRKTFDHVPLFSGPNERDRAGDANRRATTRARCGLGISVLVYYGIPFGRTAPVSLEYDFQEWCIAISAMHENGGSLRIARKGKKKADALQAMRWQTFKRRSGRFQTLPRWSAGNESVIRPRDRRVNHDRRMPSPERSKAC